MKNTKLNNLMHVEDTIFHPNAFFETLKVLEHIHLKITKNIDLCNINVSTKIDGSPSIIFGYHPKTLGFFVATKSIFNKTPKINYCYDDIVKNHGHSKGLVDILNKAANYLPKVMPLSGGVFQGDILFDESSKYMDDATGDILFIPNTIEYSVNIKSPIYSEIANSKFGIAIHTKYEGIPLNDIDISGMHPVPFDGETLHTHADVHTSNVEFKFDPIIKYNADGAGWLLPSLRYTYEGVIQNDDLLYRHERLFKLYVNSKLRNNDTTFLSVLGYKNFVKSRYTKEIVKLKSTSGKTRKEFEMSGYINDINKHEQELWMMMKLYSNVQDLKNIIVDYMNSCEHEYIHTYDNEITYPEGYVVSSGDLVIKFIHRHAFSRFNFQQDL